MAKPFDDLSYGISCSGCSVLVPFKELNPFLFCVLGKLSTATGIDSVLSTNEEKTKFSIK